MRPSPSALDSDHPQCLTDGELDDEVWEIIMGGSDEEDDDDDDEDEDDDDEHGANGGNQVHSRASPWTIYLQICCIPFQALSLRRLRAQYAMCWRLADVNAI